MKRHLTMKIAYEDLRAVGDDFKAMAMAIHDSLKDFVNISNFTAEEAKIAGVETLAHCYSVVIVRAYDIVKDTYHTSVLVGLQ